MRYLITLILVLGIAAMFSPSSSGDLDAWNNGQNANITVSNVVTTGSISIQQGLVTGLTVTNSADQIGAQISGFSGQTNALQRWSNGGTNLLGISNLGAIRATNGSAANPSYSFGASTNTGLWYNNQLVVVVGGQNMAAIVSGDWSLKSTTSLGWSSGDPNASGSDLRLGRDSANVLQQGADSATPSAQTYKLGGDGSGTDKNGGNGTIVPGQSTGTGRAGTLVIRTGTTSSTGSSTNAYLDRARYIPKYVDLTDATATSLFTVSLPATNTFGCSFTCTVTASDGTDFQSLTTQVTVDAVAKTTTITAVVAPTAAQSAVACTSAATLSVTYTVVDNGSNVLAVKANADTSFGSPTYLRANIVMTGININGTATITEL